MGRNLHARTVDGARDTMMTVISKKRLGRQRRRRRRRRSTFIDNNDLLLLLPYSLEAFFIIPQSPTSVFQIVFCSFKTERTFNGTVTARSCLNSQVPSLDDKDTKILRISACYNVRRHDVWNMQNDQREKSWKTCLHRTRRRLRRRSTFSFLFLFCIFKVEKGRKTVAKFINVKICVFFSFF